MDEHVSEEGPPEEVYETGQGDAGTTHETAITEETEDSKQIQGETQQIEDIEVDPATIEKLTNGVLEMFLPNLQKAKGSLNELLHNQEVLIETVQQENSKFTDSASMKQLIQTMHEAKLYHGKLVNLKKEMNTLMDKSTKLKHRAVKLQQQKQKDELTRAAQHERELERERMLTAKVAKQPSVEKTS